MASLHLYETTTEKSDRHREFNQPHAHNAWIHIMLVSQLVVSFVLVLVASGTSATTATSTVILGDNWCTDTLDLLVFFLDFLCICFGIRVQPRLAVLQSIQDFLFLVRIHLLT